MTPLPPPERTTVRLRWHSLATAAGTLGIDEAEVRRRIDDGRVTAIVDGDELWVLLPPGPVSPETAESEPLARAAATLQTLAQRVQQGGLPVDSRVGFLDPSEQSVAGGSPASVAEVSPTPTETESRSPDPELLCPRCGAARLERLSPSLYHRLTRGRARFRCAACGSAATSPG